MPKTQSPLSDQVVANVTGAETDIDEVSAVGPALAEILVVTTYSAEKTVANAVIVQDGRQCNGNPGSWQS